MHNLIVAIVTVAEADAKGRFNSIVEHGDCSLAFCIISRKIFTPHQQHFTVEFKCPLKISKGT